MLKLPSSEKSLPEKALALGAIGMGVGFGTCTLGAMAGRDRFSGLAVAAGTYLFFASLAVCVSTLLLMLGRAIWKRFNP